MNCIILNYAGWTPKACSNITVSTGMTSITYTGTYSNDAANKWDSGTNITILCTTRYAIDPSIVGNIWCNNGGWSDSTGSTVTPACIGSSIALFKLIFFFFITKMII